MKPERIPKITVDSEPPRMGELPALVWHVNRLYTLKLRRTDFAKDSCISVYREGIEIAYIDPNSYLINALLTKNLPRVYTLPAYILRALKRFHKLTRHLSTP